MNAFIRLLYALLIAVAVVLFVSVSIYSLYPGPKAPEYPQIYYSADGSNDKEGQEAQQQYEKQYKDFNDQQKQYQRNVSMFAVGAAVVIVLAGLWYMRRNEIIGEGIALGGVGVSLYAVITSMIADHRIMRFIAVTTLLAGSLLLVHRRFMEKPATKKRR